MKLIQRQCELCSSGFMTVQAELNRGRGRFCGRECAHKWLTTTHIKKPGCRRERFNLRRKTIFRNRERARDAVYRARRKGLLIKQPCLFCNSQENIQAHHEDYSKPLEVIWLCMKCHRQYHATKTG